MDETRSPYLKPIEGDIFLFHHTQAHVRILAIREGYVMLREHGKKPYLLLMWRMLFYLVLTHHK